MILLAGACAIFQTKDGFFFRSLSGYGGAHAMLTRKRDKSTGRTSRSQGALNPRQGALTHIRSEGETNETTSTVIRARQHQNPRQHPGYVPRVHGERLPSAAPSNANVSYRLLDVSIAQSG